MKPFLSTLALALALGFAMPAFAGDVTTAKNAADCEKAGGMWMLRPAAVQRKRCRADFSHLMGSGPRANPGAVSFGRP